MSDQESLVDTALLDWLSAYIENGIAEMGFEMDGGVYLRMSQPGLDDIDIREAKNLRAAVLAAMRMKRTVIQHESHGR